MTRQPDRRSVLAGLGTMAAGLAAPHNRAEAQAMDGADLILFNGKITTLDRQNPEATACGSACGIHGHEHVWGSRVVPSNDRAFWGALGCSCWAV